MSETTQGLLRRGLEIVESYAVWQGDVMGAEQDAAALDAVAAVVRRELEAPATGEDVRERVAREVFTLDADWRREYWDQFRLDFPRQAQAYYDTADRILALLRVPRGEGEAEPVAWRVEYRRRGDGDARWYHLSTYTNEMDARERAKHAEGAMRVLECRIIPLYASPAAALRSEAQGEDRWEDVVFGPITEAYNEAHDARPGEGGGDGE